MNVLGRRPGAGVGGSLRDAFDRSWLGLEPQLRRALAAFTIFRGGFDVPAAEALLGQIEPACVGLEVVQALRDRSLLAVDSELGRLRLAPTLREFCAEQLAEPARAQVELAHTAYYLEAGELARDAADRGEEESHRWLTIEHQNLLAIVDRIATRRRPSAQQAEHALRALLVLAPGRGTGPPAWGYLRVIAPAVSATVGSGADPRLFARGLLLRGEAVWQHQRAPSALVDLARAHDLARTTRDVALEAQAAQALANTLVDRAAQASSTSPNHRGPVALDASGSPEDVAALLGHAAELYTRSEELHAHEGRGAAAARAALGAAVLTETRGRPEAAVVMVERAAVRLERSGDRHSAASAYHHVARIRLDLSEHESCQAALRRAGDLLDTGDPRVLLVRLDRLRALLDLDRGELRGVAARLERCADELGALGLGYGAAVALGDAGVAAHVSGDLPRAHVLLSDALGRLGEHSDAERGRLGAHLSLLEAGATEGGEAPHHGVPRSGAAARAFDRCAGALAGIPPGKHLLLVGSDGVWFRPPHGERVSLERRRPLAKLLWCLAQARLTGAGGVEREGLIAAGWPDERILVAPAVHRVRVAISTLRKLGLGAALLTTEDGYGLDPTTPVELVD